LSDLFDVYYYTASAKHPFNEIAYEEYMMVGSGLTYLVTDGFYCVKSMQDDQTFWSSEANFWYMAFNDGLTGSWESLPDTLYMSAFLVQITSSVLIMLKEPQYMTLEVPRLLAALQKNLYYYLADINMSL